MDNSELPGDHERVGHSESPASMSGSPSSRGDEMDTDSGAAAGFDTGTGSNDYVAMWSAVDLSFASNLSKILQL